ncbi:MAG TPA: FHA domain-containing protein, partial [Vicinamibacterales bacterium]|nr:FHA domain-containing protein [Vicinamibacterales bacterium]
MPDPRLQVRDVLGEREVALDRFPFTIGRRETNNLRLGGSEVSREHAEIQSENGRLILRDKESRYGTFVNGEPVTECDLRSGDRIRLGRGGGADLVFVAADDARSLTGRSTTGARDDL